MRRWLSSVRAPSRRTPRTLSGSVLKSCSVERLWSVLRNVARDNRPRLGIEKTELLFIVAEERMASKDEEDVPQEYLVESVLGF